MRIPLDYYRILGLPIQATADQLRQAHRDRLQQLPRREYSEVTVAVRRSLIDQAYTVLSEATGRRAYDSSFLAKTYELTGQPTDSGADVFKRERSITAISVDSDANTPTIEIEEDQFVGALLLLQELGEYELVLKLGRPFLTGGSARVEGGQFGEPEIVYPDIVLTVALACLELGREQWKQGQYENAAEALETGEKLLLRERLFASLRSEIQADLYKLRPYRILELLALPDDQTEARYRGIQLLQEMLQERGGIDGTGNDHSGLGIDDFLKFIQQLRGYLTAAEQQVLFEEEARRPSAVATYLAVYALLGRGFAEHQPALVRRAKLLLTPLGTRQDVSLENSVCSLLLGQTEEASFALEQSQEYAPIAFIREHSQNSPDLLPGLCLYAENWLQQEVFPHFRDLTHRKPSLREYFADDQVQTYLEELPLEIGQDQPVVMPYAVAGATAFAAQPTLGHHPIYDSPAVARDRWAQPPSTEAFRSADTGNDILPYNPRIRSATLAPEGQMLADESLSEVEEVQAGFTLQTSAQPAEKAVASRRSHRGGGRGRSGASGRRERSGQSNFTIAGRSLPAWFLPASMLLGMVALGFLVAWLVRGLQQASTKSASSIPQQLPSPNLTLEEQPNIPLESPLVELATAPTPGTLNNPQAQKVVETWLAAKSAAMGPNHDASQLDGILIDPRLSEWKGASAEAKRDNWYKQYKHQVKIVSVDQNTTKPEEATVVADVSESTDYYVGGTLKDSTSDPNLQVRYRLIRQDGKWLIQDWGVQ